MLLSRLFTQTRRETPADITLPGQQALFRAGYVQATPTGSPILLPLGQRLLVKLEDRLRGELNRLGGLEVGLPAVAAYGFVWAEVARSQLRSYRQLPAQFYHFNWRDASAVGWHPALGLIGARHSRVLSIHLLAADETQRSSVAHQVRTLLENLLSELDIPFGLADYLPDSLPGDGGAMVYPLESATEIFLRCSSCDYCAHLSIASYQREPALGYELPLLMEKVPTPETKTIAALAELLGIPEQRTAKAVFLATPRGELVFAVTRGDRDLNVTALERVLDAAGLVPASEDLIRKAGAVPGYASPVGLSGVRVVVDAQIPLSPNLAAGANEDGYHLLNVNYGRDYTGQIAEIALARAGDACPYCGKPLSEQRGVMLVEERTWPATFTERQGLGFVDEQGQGLAPLTTSVRLDLTRLLGCLAEAHHDDYGLALPATAAPWPVQVVSLAGKDEYVAAETLRTADMLAQAGLEPLVDDRPDSPGVKFNDADLIGLPVRVTVSQRSLAQGGVELKKRGGGEKELVKGERLAERIRNMLGASS